MPDSFSFYGQIFTPPLKIGFLSGNQHLNRLERFDNPKPPTHSPETLSSGGLTRPPSPPGWREKWNRAPEIFNGEKLIVWINPPQFDLINLNLPQFECGHHQAEWSGRLVHQQETQQLPWWWDGFLSIFNAFWLSKMCWKKPPSVPILNPVYNSTKKPVCKKTRFQ